MLKLTSLTIGALAAISIVPAAQAVPIAVNNSNFHQETRTNTPQVVVSINPQTRQEPQPHRGWEADRRQLELAREREARARWEAAHRPRYQQYTKHHHHSDSNRGYDRNDYRRDR